MGNFSLGEPQSIAVDKFNEHAAFVLCSKSDADAVVERFGRFNFSFAGVSDLPQKKAGFFAQRIMTPDRDEHFLCITPMAGNASLFVGRDQVVLAFKMPLKHYQEERTLFQRYIDLSTEFFIADNRSAHDLVDRLDLLLMQFPKFDQ
jgi:hypothetical protein